MKLIPSILVFLLFFLSGCNGLFYYPTRQHLINPDELGLKYEDVYLKDEKKPDLHGWMLLAKEPAQGTILFLHGNAENVSTHLGGVYWLPAKGFNVFMLDYRGYGLSEGEASVEGIHDDVKRAIHYLKRREDLSDTPLILFGQSLGGTMALYTAALPEFQGVFKAVIAESSFQSYRQIVRDKLHQFWLTRFFKYPLSWLVGNKYSPTGLVKLISPTPLLFVHGTEDETVPMQHSQDLYSEAAEPKQIWIIPEGGHIAAFKTEQYRKRLVEFIKNSLIEAETIYQSCIPDLRRSARL